MNEHGQEIWSGGVETWQCDANGHLNVRFYVAYTIEALGGLAAELGMPRVYARDGEATLVVRDQHLRFLREAHAADGLYMTGGIVEMGETDARILTIMHHISGEVAAVFQTVVEHVTARELRPFPWPQRVRDKAQAWTIAVPPDLAPRSLGITRVETQASLARAEAFGLRRGVLGVISPEECDIFGRIRPEMFIGRISQGGRRAIRDEIFAAQLREGQGVTTRVGAAVLEYRLLYVDWPQAGDRMELRSGLASCDNRFRRIFHWLVDPDSGRPWATAEALIASLDLEARKMLILSPETQAVVNGLAVPGLTL